MDRTRLAGILILIVSLALLGAGVHLLVTQEERYYYEVKSEQVATDAGYNGTATTIDQLDPAYQEALFDAYRESDHFLGGASATIVEDEPLGLTDEQRSEFQVVSIEGVHLLVGVSGPEVGADPTAGFLSGILLGAGGISLFCVLLVWWDNRQMSNL